MSAPKEISTRRRLRFFIMWYRNPEFRKLRYVTQKTSQLPSSCPPSGSSCLVFSIQAHRRRHLGMAAVNPRRLSPIDHTGSLTPSTVYHALYCVVTIAYTLSSRLHKSLCTHDRKRGCITTLRSLRTTRYISWFNRMSLDTLCTTY